METKPKVLIIDDDPDLLETTRLFLDSRDFDVVTALEPEQGLRLAEQEKPDVVVLDVMMPHGTEGFHWVWNVRRHSDPAVRDVPIIILTSLHDTTAFRFAGGDAESDETGEYLPVQGFVEKPIDPDALAARIQSILAHRV